jgi:hypothetical protein
MANSNNWGEIYKSTWWGDKAWSANTLFIDSAPPGFGLNLLKASEDLDNTIDWDRLPDTTDVPTVSANTITDPNGGTTAERVDFTANRQARLQQRVTLEASKEYTFSIYAKVNTGTQNFRLRNVTLGDAESKTATTSWTRFSYTFTTTTAGDYDLSLQNNDNTARTLEFWGAMLNEGATAGDYVKTDGSFSGSAPAPAYAGFGDAFGGVTAYYSLRKFTEAETLNAIRVRRSSDDTEQDIGFDANGDLDTTALTTFVNEDVDVYTSDFSSTEDLTETNGTGAAAQSVGGVDDAYKFSTITGTGQMYASIAPFSGKGGGNSFRVQADVYLPSTNSEIDKVSIWTGYGAETFADVTATDTWTSIDQTITITQGSALRFQAYDGSDITPTTTGANVFYLKNIVVTQTTADGAVTTFYDQTGNGNDATNSTESEQPLVVSGGTLVEENSKAAIDFDGVDDYFSFTTPTTLSDEFFITTALNSNPSGTWGILLHNQTISTERIRLYDNGNIELRINGTTHTYSSAYTPNTQELLTIERDSADSLEIYVDGTSQGSNTEAADWTGILGYLGSNQSQTSGQFYTGTFQELIIFDSDQSTNRTGMETNINDHFDIYTP